MSEDRISTLGDLVLRIYEEYLDVYGDKEIAELATSVTVNEMLLESVHDQGRRHEAA